MLNTESLRKDFPVLTRQVRSGQDLVYFDNAATTQKPQVVIDAVRDYYSQTNANIHRAIHELGEEATEQYEAVRSQTQQLLGAQLPSEIIFTAGTTESINLVAYAWGRINIIAGDEILLSEMEHHANLVPWQQLARETGAKLRFIPVTEEGELDLRNIKGLLTNKTKLLAVVHASNFLGTLNELDELTKLAKKRGAAVLIDAAQSVPHHAVKVNKLRADFLAFSAHKMCGPTGVGVLYVTSERYSQMQPFLTGGSMIKKVDFENSTFADPPQQFEAGTPNIAGVIGFGAALTYLGQFEEGEILRHEQELVAYALKRFEELGSVCVYGPCDPQKRVGVLAFSVEGIHSHDLATVLDENGVAIRSGHHCVQPMHRKLGVNDSARASFYLYNTKDEVDTMIEAIAVAKRLFL